MSDIVERLRSWARTALDKTEDAGPLATLREAADEIERLRANLNLCVAMLESAEAECEILKALAGDPVAIAENVKKVDLLRQREERGE